MSSLARAVPTHPRPTGSTILVVDDEPLVRWSLRRQLEDDGHAVIEAATGEEARTLFQSGIELVLLDFKLPDLDGMTLLAEMTEANPDVPIIMLTAHSSVEHAVRAMHAGAFHYAGKPFDLEDVSNSVRSALETTRLKRLVQAMKSKKEDYCSSCSLIVGESYAIKQAKRLVCRIASTPASTVLVTGESGTGKDMVSRAIHAESDRANGPFLNITCSALPAALLESELFGHERGAFTDARTRKQGLLEHADGGTVFLDEIGEMELTLQAKLLRFLEEKTFRRVGGVADIRTNVRIVAATNVDLRDAVDNGAFREDLFYRLAVLTLHIAPLREREGDVELLAAVFIDRFNNEFGKRVRGIKPAAMRRLAQSRWPGNVRELRNAIERAVLLAETDTLGVEDFELLTPRDPNTEPFHLPAAGLDFREVERSFVTQALERTRGNQTQAAALLGMNRDQIRYRMDRFGLAHKRRK